MEGTDEDGRTLLHVAAQHNAISFANTLLDAPHRYAFPRFTPTLRDAEENTILHTAASAGAYEIVQAVVGRMAGDKSFLELKNTLGRTALHLAAFYGHVAIAEFLIAKVMNLF